MNSGEKWKRWFDKGVVIIESLLGGITFCLSVIWVGVAVWLTWTLFRSDFFTFIKGMLEKVG